MRFLRKNVSGLAVPNYALDITGGLGKVPLDYQYLKRHNGKVLHLESPSGENGSYAMMGERADARNVVSVVEQR